MPRKVDEALEVMRKASFQYARAARKVIRYGNIEDMENLEEELVYIVDLARRLAEASRSDRVARRLQREIDRIAADALAKGRI